jgi:hypothetical protein
LRNYCKRNFFWLWNCCSFNTISKCKPVLQFFYKRIFCTRYLWRDPRNWAFLFSTVDSTAPLPLSHILTNLLFQNDACME